MLLISPFILIFIVDNFDRNGPFDIDSSYSKVTLSIQLRTNTSGGGLEPMCPFSGSDGGDARGL